VNAFFHGLSFNLAVANPRATVFERTASRREPLAYGRKTAIMPENQSLDDFCAGFLLTVHAVFTAVLQGRGACAHRAAAVAWRALRVSRT
jgi:hypothetical protein